MALALRDPEQDELGGGSYGWFPMRTVFRCGHTWMVKAPPAVSLHGHHARVGDTVSNAEPDP